MKTESLRAVSAREISSAGVAPWTEIHSFPIRMRGKATGGAVGASVELATAVGILDTATGILATALGILFN